MRQREGRVRVRGREGHSYGAGNRGLLRERVDQSGIRDTGTESNYIDSKGSEMDVFEHLPG